MTISSAAILNMVVHMKKFIPLIFLIASFTALNGQRNEPFSTNSISVEVGKTGLIYSIVFDRMIKNNLGLRVTAGTSFSSYLRAFSTFVGPYYLVGSNTKYLELGVDIGYLSINENITRRGNRAFIFPDFSIKTYYLNANVGYRKYGKKTMFRFGASPGYSKSGPFPGAYISYGLRF